MEPFKNLMNEIAARKIADAITRAHPSFDSKGFLKGIEAELEPLELKERMHAIKTRLIAELPEDPALSIPILIGALKQNEEDGIGVCEFVTWPLTQFVAERGLAHFELSMNALHQMTQVFTAEFAIRPFLIHHEEKTLKQLESWTRDPNEHVRRLVSEGSRPLLPWGEQIPAFVKDPAKTWPLLEALRNDPAKYVQKSVANHVNDHSKNHGDWVVTQLTRWHEEKDAPGSLHWIIRHATRTLVKQGHPGALALHGIQANCFKLSEVEVLTSKLKLGEKFEVRFRIKNESDEKATALIDHEIHFLKANGKTSPKVFKGTRFDLESGESRLVHAKIPLKLVTTRRYYAGTQGWALLINGERQKQQEFELKT